MAVIKLTKNDVGFNMDFTITDADGDAVDLSSSTVIFRVGGPSEVPIISGACTGMDTSGQCSYAIAAGDLDMEGIFQGELQITTGTQIITTKNIEVRIGGEL